MRLVMTRVLPDPAPARISSGPLMCRTASRCSGLRVSRNCITTSIMTDAPPRVAPRRRLDSRASRGAAVVSTHERRPHDRAAPLAGARAASRSAQRPAGAARRCRIRADVDVRRTDSHADARLARRRRTPVHALPRHRVVLADARGAAHRPQQPRRRDGHDHELVERRPRLHRLDSEVGGVRVGHPASERVRDGEHRQVAPDSRSRDDAGRPVRSLADAPGLRLLLRVSRR